MPTERPFLTARWTELLILNFAVPREVVARIAPPGTEPDLHDGQAYASVIGFQFRDPRLRGLALPGHRRFAEVNLRYYVRRQAGGQVRRGVVFVREIAPQPAVAAVARWVYNESYVTRRMQSQVCTAGDRLAAGDRVGYAWQNGRWPIWPWRSRRWSRIRARVAAAPQLPAAGSLEEFIVEHYWAYVRGRDGTTREYRVAHRPWRVAAADEVAWECDVAATYGDTPFAPFLERPPTMAMIADGSPVQVFRGRPLDVDAATPFARRGIHHDGTTDFRLCAGLPTPHAGAQQ